MKNKNKKGFTLIELLAIIVILAIIAVITVPIILNIIDNSKKGAATDSAYGFKDAVNKWYVEKLAADHDFMLKSQYTVQDGKIKDASDSNDQGILIPVSGEKPSSGYLNYSNNVLTGGCLVIGDYAVTFTNGSTTTVKGTCSQSSEQGGNGGNEPAQTTVAPIVYSVSYEYNDETENDEPVFTQQPAGTIPSVDDYVKIGDEGFYVIGHSKNRVINGEEYAAYSGKTYSDGYDGDFSVYLLAEYNLSNTAGENEEPNWQQTSSCDYDVVPFYEEEDMYYYNKIATCEESGPYNENYYHPMYGDDSYPYVYDSGQNTKITAALANYGTYIRNLLGRSRSIKTRLASYYEINGLNNEYWAFNQYYYTGSTSLGGGSNKDNTEIQSYYTMCGPEGYSPDQGVSGIRPVIELHEDDFGA